MSQAPVKVLSSHIVYSNRYIAAHADVLSKSGRQWEQAYVTKPHPEHDVVVVPYENGGVYLLNQYRHANTGYFWQFPGGSGEDEQSSDEVALRELNEETGLIAGKLRMIGQTCAEPGLVRLKTTIYVATDLTHGKQHFEHSEIGMKVAFFTLSKIEEMIRSGEIMCGFTLAAWLFFRTYLFENQKK
ncbi:MAG: NUDIX hydrolase [Candidatus Roizmanbacteria bacterium]